MSPSSVRQLARPGSSHELECACATGPQPVASRNRQRHSRAEDNVVVLAEMTGGITHDFRNILAVIDAGIAMAERHANEPDQARRFLAGARESVQRGLKLTSRLLEFTKEQDDVQRRDMNELLRQLQVFLKYGAGPDVGVVFQLAPSLPRCVIGLGGFGAAILNLIVNARDAMPGGGEIRIGTALVSQQGRSPGTSQTFVRVSVEDTGQGMPEAVLRKVFNRHFTTKGDAGTGLGLPQVCAFMTRAGGHVNVRSTVGSGTTFELDFPTEAPLPESDSAGAEGLITSREPAAPDRRRGDIPPAVETARPALAMALSGEFL